jgi:hypothetical protein
MRSLVGGSATEFLLGDAELEYVNGEQRIDADLTLVSTSVTRKQHRRRNLSGDVGATDVARMWSLVCRLSTARRRRKPRNCGAFECAEEDSNLHPLSVDQAVNLVTHVSYPSYASRTSDASTNLDAMDVMEDLDVATNVATSGFVA